MKARRKTILVWGAIALLLLTGCAGTTTRSLGVDASDVAEIQYYEYPWGSVPSTLDRLTIDDPAAIAEWLRGYKDMPTTAWDPEDAGDAIGKETRSTRFILADGDIVEVTTIWVSGHNVIVVWPDGKVYTTEWGSPGTMKAWQERGMIQEVDAAERPKVALPG